MATRLAAGYVMRAQHRIVSVQPSLCSGPGRCKQRVCVQAQQARQDGQTPRPRANHCRQRTAGPLLHRWLAGAV